MTLTPPNSEALTIEYKINFLSPAQGERLVARGRVTKPGRTVTVCNGDVVAVSEGKEKLFATMPATMMTVGGQHSVSWPPSTPMRELAGHERSVSPRWCPCRRLRGIKRWLRVDLTMRTASAV